ncbi:hypothetical protein TNCV_5018701 [Trichonephila clavipes]|nr:hypothetical protein TNCV_5018701 [Trichonephila clavipes]
MVLPQEDRVSNGHVSLLRGKTTVCIWRTAEAHRTASAAEIQAAIATTVTQQTVRNRLLQGQLRVRPAPPRYKAWPLICDVTLVGRNRPSPTELF